MWPAEDSNRSRRGSISEASETVEALASKLCRDVCLGLELGHIAEANQLRFREVDVTSLRRRSEFSVPGHRVEKLIIQGGNQNRVQVGAYGDKL